MSNGRIFISTPAENKLSARRVSDGATIWEATVSEGLVTKQLAADDHLLFLAAENLDATIQAYSQTSGQRIWVSPDSAWDATHYDTNHEVFVPTAGYVCFWGRDILYPIYGYLIDAFTIYATEDKICEAAGEYVDGMEYYPSDPAAVHYRPLMWGGEFFWTYGPYYSNGWELDTTEILGFTFDIELARVLRGNPVCTYDPDPSGCPTYMTSRSYEYRATGAPIAAVDGLLLTLAENGELSGVLRPRCVWPTRNFEDPQWSVPLGLPHDSSVAAGGGYIVALSDSTLTLLNYAGVVVDSVAVSGSPTTGPTLVSNKVLYGDSLGTVHVVDLATLNEDVINISTGAIIGDVVVTQDGVYVASADGTLARLVLISQLGGCDVRSPGYVQNGHQAVGPGGVNTLSGNMVFTVQDVSLPFAGLSVNLLRTYNSQNAIPADRFSPSGTVDAKGSAIPGDPFDSVLSDGWTHSYQVALRPQYDGATGATLYVEERGDGRQPGFSHSETGTARPPGIEDDFEFSPAAYALSETSTGQGVRLTKKSGLAREFDPDGNLLAVKDPSGNELKLKYVSATEFNALLTGTRLRRIVYISSTPQETSTVYLDYDPQGHLSKVEQTHPDGGTSIETLYAYDTDGLLSSVTGPDSLYESTYFYDGFGRMTEKIDPRAPPGEKHLQFEYDDRHRVTAVKSGSGSVVARYSYLAGFLSQEEGEQGFTQHHETHITEFGDGFQAVTRHIYNDCGLLSSVHDAEGGITRYQWDIRLNQISMRDANNNSTTWFYDGRGNVVRAFDALGNEVNYEYETDFNQITKKTDAKGDETFFSYDGTGNLTGTVEMVQPILDLGDTTATGYATKHAYDSRGLRLSTTEANGSETYYAYDGIGNLTATAQRLWLTQFASTEFITRYEYDAMGRRTAQIDSKGVRTEYSYDLENRLTQVRYGILPSSTPLTTVDYKYDDLNRLERETDAAGRFTAYSYNDRDLLESVSDTQGHTTTHVYDLMGNRTMTVDANGNSTSYTYDKLGRLVQVTDAEGGTALYTYDAVGNLLTVTDPNGHKTRYEYDILNRVTRLIHPDGTQEEFTYDAVGNRLTREDARGKVATNTYDSLNRLRRIEYNDTTPEVTFKYDPAGNRTEALTTVSAQDYKLGYEYDSLDRLTKERIFVGPLLTVEKRFGYDSVGNRIVFEVDALSTAELDHRIAYTYDVMDRLSSVASRGKVTSYGYDLSGNVIRTQFPNRVETKLRYDSANRLLGLRHVRQPTGLALSFFEYTYDAMNNRTSMRDIVGLHAYGYDTLYRLTSVDYPTYPDQAYAYDPAGNRLTQSITGEPQRVYAYNSTNALENVQAGATQYTYTWDLAGNVDKKDAKIGAKTDTTDYVFDAANRLVQATIPSGDILQYGYDTDGKRVNQIAAGKATWFVFDGLSVVMELGDDKKPTTLLVPGVSKTRLDAEPPLTEYYLLDGLGSVVQMTDALGNPTQTYQYDVFGATQNIDRDPFNRYHFVGLTDDDSLGLIYMNARWYDPRTGLFVSREPTRLKERLNSQELGSYLYVFNNPINLTDIGGLFVYNKPSPRTKPLTPEMRKKILKLEFILGEELVVSGGTEKHTIASQHQEGRAVDIWPLEGVDSTQVAQAAKALGLVSGLNEVNSALHYHLQEVPMEQRHPLEFVEQVSAYKPTLIDKFYGICVDKLVEHLDWGEGRVLGHEEYVRRRNRLWQATR